MKNNLLLRGAASFFAFAILFAGLAACASHPGNPVLGKWKLYKATSLATAILGEKAVMAEFKQTFGNMYFTFKPKTATIELGSQSQSGPVKYTFDKHDRNIVYISVGGDVNITSMIFKVKGNEAEVTGLNPGSGAPGNVTWFFKRVS